jgi:hypothetical protein
MSKTIDAELITLFEEVGFTVENLAKARMIFEHAVHVRVADIEEDLDAKFEVREAQLIEAIDNYLGQQLDESIDDIRKLMLLAVSQIGGP